MVIAEKSTYLKDIARLLIKHWPENRTVNIVCHGHSVPAGYFATPMVNTFSAYPHLLHIGLKERYPFAVINVIVSAIGGEDSESGCKRIESDVLCHNPDVLTIDYGLNDRRLTLDAAKKSWCTMIESALNRDVKVLLLTPTWDNNWSKGNNDWNMLESHAQQIREIAGIYHVGLVDVFEDFRKYVNGSQSVSELLSWTNHPNYNGHKIVADNILSWFPII